MQIFLLSIFAVTSFYFASCAIGQDQLVLPPVILEVRGAISKGNTEGAAHFNIEELKALPPAWFETTTAVTDGIYRFDGFLMRDLLAHVGAEGTVVTARALNDYAIEIPIEEFYRFDVLVAYEMGGEPLLPSEKGPLWIVYPRDQHIELQDIRFDYRWVWQLKSLEVR